MSRLDRKLQSLGLLAYYENFFNHDENVPAWTWVPYPAKVAMLADKNNKNTKTTQNMVLAY